MRVSAAFPSKFLRAVDLQGSSPVVTIERVGMDEVEKGKSKPILYFTGKEKGVALNKTNANTIADAYGDETDAWMGKKIQLFVAMVDFQGRMVDAIRVRIPPAASAQPPVQPPQPDPPQSVSGQAVDAFGLPDDEVPF